MAIKHMNKIIYLKVFLVTCIIFAFTLWLSNTMSNQKLKELSDLENQISLNILSTETRFSLLEKTSCEHLVDKKDSRIGFNDELTALAKKVKFMENQLGLKNKNVNSIKEYYTLLQIKDYLLSKEFQSRCGERSYSLLYFFDNECKDCSKQSVILDAVSQKYPQIRVYWFDKSVSTPALDTLISLFNISKVPSLIIGDKLYDGMQTLEKIENYIPETKVWIMDSEAQSNVATTTKS